jgi:hypothetical protein
VQRLKVVGLALSAALCAAHQAQSFQEARVLWRDPGPIAQRDLFWGSGSAERAPKPPFRFVKENTKGTSPKVVVTDANGSEWSVKFGSEAHSEVAAGRLLWAFGYPVQEMYYVHEGTIAGVRDLERADDVIKGDGTFWEARFERRDPKMVEGKGWPLSGNPFDGTKEMSGLLLLFALINNWDTDLAKNQAIYTVTTDAGSEQWYVADDIGASFGRFEERSPIKWNVAEYRKDKLIARVEGDAIVLNYRAYGTPPTRVPMESQLTEAQVRKAFEAAGTPAEQIGGFTTVFMQKLEELKKATAGR